MLGDMPQCLTSPIHVAANLTVARSRSKIGVFFSISEYGLVRDGSRTVLSESGTDGLGHAPSENDGRF